MRKSFASRALGLLPLTLIFGSSCSLVYDLSPDQCGNNSDCERMFGQGFVCSDGICDCESPVCTGVGGKGTGGMTGGTSGSGGDVGAMGGDAGSGEVGGTSGAGGAMAGRGAGGSAGRSNGGNGGSTGGSTGDAGMAGVPIEPECTQNRDCFEKHDDSNTNPYACVLGTCQPLYSAECPVILPLSDNGDWALINREKGSTDPYILGGFANVPGGVPGIGTKNYDLALQELSEEVSGVYANSGSRHQVVMVVCNSAVDNADDVIPPGRHLINDLGVKGIVASMAAEHLQGIWEDVGENNGVFFMMPINSDQSLIDIPDQGLIWHMLAGANALSVSLQPLLDMTRTHLENSGAKMAADDLKVALMSASDDRFLDDIGEYFKANISFNGELAKNNAANFKSVSVTSGATDDNTDAISAVIDFIPHVIIGSTTDDMLKRTIPLIESNWNADTGGAPRPIYILSPYNYVRTAMAGLITSDASSPPLYTRILGLNWPAAVDQSIYDDYLLRYEEQYQMQAPGNENFYDAAWYTLYALAASSQPLSGAQLANGMLRITTGTQTTNVGPVPEMGSNITQLGMGTSHKIKLIGAMGPPAWDLNGARNDPGSIWCVDGTGAYFADVLRYNAGTLSGDTSDCFTFPAP